MWETSKGLRITVPPGCRTGIHANTLLEVHRMYNAVGIDVSKGKSTVAVFLIAGSISWGIKRTYCGSSTCINRTAAMTGWLTGFLTDANGPRRCRQTDA